MRSGMHARLSACQADILACAQPSIIAFLQVFSRPGYILTVPRLLGSSIWDSEPIVPIITDPSIVGCDIAWCQACNVAHNVQAIGLFIIFLFYSLHPSD
ncbi:unnamed protein product, partial [Mycena citricolor]